MTLSPQTQFQKRFRETIYKSVKEIATKVSFSNETAVGKQICPIPPPEMIAETPRPKITLKRFILCLFI